MTSEIKLYLEFAAKEATNIQVYASAAVIGSIICFFTHHYSAVPFIVPLLVQILVKSNVRFRSRHKDALIELPAQTEAPALIMDIQGNIVLSIGRTLEIFNQYAITNIKEFINKEAFEEIIHTAFAEENAQTGNNSVEVFSPRTMKWYEIQSKATGIRYGSKEQKVLVWFQDITLRKIYQLRLGDLLRYSNSLIDSLEEQLKPDTEYDHLSLFLLKEYEAVFITRADKENNLQGYVYKNAPDRIIKSDIITISSQSLAPINVSRKKAQIITEDISSYDSIEAFLRYNPLDPAVLKFIGAPVRNFITFNEADLSIIAFNFRSRITDYEKDFFKIVVNIYRTMVILVDLKKETRKHDREN